MGDSRSLEEISSESVDLALTSPPYWNIKDYGVEGQIGYNQNLKDYLKSLFLTWKETYRVLKPGTRLCVNVGDQFLRASQYGRYKIVPIHSEIINQCITLGFDYMGSVIWQKKTTVNTTGGANLMGSYPYPRNGLLEIDYEYILIFRKPGKTQSDKEKKLQSVITKEEWKEYFSGHWQIGGKRQSRHEAMFPDEIPLRIIRMFSFVGDTVMDPFLGSGTTMRVALQNGRNCIGYEINPDYLQIIGEGVQSICSDSKNITFEVTERKNNTGIETTDEYEPVVQNVEVSTDRTLKTVKKLYKVRDIKDSCELLLDPGLTVKFHSLRIVKSDATLQYLRKYVRGRYIVLKSVEKESGKTQTVSAEVYLKNGIFINRELLKRDLAVPDSKP